MGLDNNFEIDTFLLVLKEIDNAPIEQLNIDESSMVRHIVTLKKDKNTRRFIRIEERLDYVYVYFVDGYEENSIKLKTSKYTFFTSNYNREYQKFKTRLKNRFENLERTKKIENINKLIDKILPNAADKELLG